MHTPSTPTTLATPETLSHSRRTFLLRSAQLAFTGAALPTALNLAAIGDAAAFAAPDGSYKALVCVFLYGANDYANTLVAYDADSYAQYNAIRTNIALPKDAALTANLLSPNSPPAGISGTTAPTGGRQYALHPAMTGMADLFNRGKAAVQLSVGPLLEPLTRADYTAGSKRIPPKLFSHNDQQSIWQSSESEGSTVGWGGNIGDLAIGPGGNTSASASFTCISVTGNAVFLAGDQALAYQVSTSGAVPINALTSTLVYNSSAVRSAVEQLVKQNGNHVLAQTYNAVTQRSINAQSVVNSAIASTANGATDAAKLAAFTPTMLANNPLASQLKMVARMIAGRTTLGPKRQVFMVSLGGFDLHDNLLTQHPGLLGNVSEAMAAFYESTVQLGVDTQVTSFTASDFGRTLTSNGDGSDHGWGSHHFVVGGDVKGKDFYGYAPPISVGNSTTLADDQWHVGQGRLLPTTSVDQYAATLATWFGVENAELPSVVPNIGKFDNKTLVGVTFKKNLGFMK
jgi:uncharacterized protein (DUF1501 family)